MPLGKRDMVPGQHLTQHPPLRYNSANKILFQSHYTHEAGLIQPPCTPQTKASQWSVMSKSSAMYLWKSPGDQTCRPGHLFVPLPPRCTLWMSSSMSWHGSSVWLSLDVCCHWSSTLKCLDRASRLALSSSCNVARWQAVSALLCI